MGKRALIMLIGCVLGVCQAGLAQVKVLTNKDLQKQADQKQVVIVERKQAAEEQKAQELKTKIEQLMEMAQKAQAQAQRFKAEAAELEKLLRGEFEKFEVKENVAILKAQVAKIAEAANRADIEGHKEKAMELRVIVEELASRAAGKAGEIKLQIIGKEGAGKDEQKTIVIRRGEGDKEEKDVKDEKQIEVFVKRFKDEAEAAREQDQLKQAGRFLIKVEEQDKNLQLEREHQEMAAHMDMLHAQHAEVMREAERAARAGRHEETADLHRHAEELEKQIEEHARHIERRHIELEVEKLHEQAHKEQMTGAEHLEKAEVIRHEAQELERRMVEEVEVEREMERNLERLIDREFGKIHEELGRLHKEIDRLRAEIEKIKRIKTPQDQPLGVII